MKRAVRGWALLVAAALFLAFPSSGGASPSAPASGGPSVTPQFAKEQAFSPASKKLDDWEPSVAADAKGNVYLITTRIAGNPTCENKCPVPSIVLKRSTDGGQTWLPDQYLCQCPGGVNGEWDPQVVAPASDPGTVYVSWIQEYTPGVTFLASHDYGKTWSHKMEVVQPYVAHSDKDWLTSSADGSDVCIFFNGNRNPIFHDKSPEGTPFVVESHDGGKSWDKPVEMPNQGNFAGGHQKRYYFASGGTVLQDGTVLAAETAYRMNYKVGRVLIYSFRSTDGGKTWARSYLDSSGRGPKCPDDKGCSFGYLGAQQAMASDSSGDVYSFYNASKVAEGPARPFLRVSTDEGKTWGPPQQMSPAPAGTNADYPMAAATGKGTVGVAWIDDRGHGYNTWFRLSTDAGTTFGNEARLSNARKASEGFGFPYGDYGNLAMGSSGVWAIWGRSPNYIGPGTTRFTHAPLG